MTNECCICLSDIDENRYLVTCEHCKKASCNECIINYNINNDYSSKIICIYKGCFDPFGVIHLEKSFNSKDFSTLFDNYVNKIIYTEERYMKLTYREFIIERYRERKKSLDEKIRESLTAENLKNITHDGPKDKLIELKRLHEEYKDINDKLINLTNKVNSIYQNCPIEDCNGYFDGEECFSCGKKFCNECLMDISEGDHICDPKGLEVAKYISRHTKQCPKCNTTISKAEGTCDQMWCVKCKTAFNWSTGVILDVNSNYHNPLYDEYIKFINKDYIFDLKSYDCYINGELSLEDLNIFPNDDRVAIVIGYIITIEQIITDNTIFIEGYNTFSSIRRSICNRGLTLRDPEVRKEISDRLINILYSQEILREHNDLIRLYCDLSKNILTYLGRKIVDNGDVVNEEMLNEFDIKSKNLTSLFVNLLDELNEKSNIFQDPRIDKETVDYIKVIKSIMLLPYEKIEIRGSLMNQ